jgi:hypothetical protein
VAGGGQRSPDVARSSNGASIAVWEGPSSDGQGLDIWAQRFDASGAPLSNDFLGCTKVAFASVDHDIAMRAGRRHRREGRLTDQLVHPIAPASARRPAPATSAP